MALRSFARSFLKISRCVMVSLKWSPLGYLLSIRISRQRLLND